MNFTVPLGLTLVNDYRVTEQDTIAAHVDLRLPLALGTFILTEWMETTAAFAVQPLLPEGYFTVGVRVDIEHLAPTPIGHTVRVEAKVCSVEGNFLLFDVTATDERELVGRASHKRAIVSVKLIERQLLRKQK